MKLFSLKNFYKIFSMYQTPPVEVLKMAGSEIFFWDPIFNPKGPSYLMGQTISANFRFNTPPNYSLIKCYSNTTTYYAVV